MGIAAGLSIEAGKIFPIHPETHKHYRKKKKKKKAKYYHFQLNVNQNWYYHSGTGDRRGWLVPAGEKSSPTAPKCRQYSRGSPLEDIN